MNWSGGHKNRFYAPRKASRLDVIPASKVSHHQLPSRIPLVEARHAPVEKSNKLQNLARELTANTADHRISTDNPDKVLRNSSVFQQQVDEGIADATVPGQSHHQPFADIPNGSSSDSDDGVSNTCYSPVSSDDLVPIKGSPLDQTSSSSATSSQSPPAVPPLVILSDSGDDELGRGPPSNVHHHQGHQHSSSSGSSTNGSPYLANMGFSSSLGLSFLTPLVRRPPTTVVSPVATPDIGENSPAGSRSETETPESNFRENLYFDSPHLLYQTPISTRPTPTNVSAYSGDPMITPIQRKQVRFASPAEEAEEAMKSKRYQCTPIPSIRRHLDDSMSVQDDLPETNDSHRQDMSPDALLLTPTTPQRQKDAQQEGSRDGGASQENEKEQGVEPVPVESPSSSVIPAPSRSDRLRGPRKPTRKILNSSRRKKQRGKPLWHNPCHCRTIVRTIKVRDAETQTSF